MGQTTEFGLRYPDISGYVRDTPAYIQNLAEDVENVLTDFEPSGGGDTLPIGVILPHGSSTIPTGYLECNGQLVSRTDYSELFEMIGTAWGEGDGSTTFAVPDMRKRVPVGLDTSDEDFDTIGKIGGEKEHTLTIDEMPSHKHGYDYDQTEGSNTGGLKTGTNNVYGGTTKATGGGQPHNIMQPYTVTCYIIKAKMGATVTKGNIIDSLDGESKIDAPSVNAVKSIVETGTTENGTYVKYANGELECRNSITKSVECNMAVGGMYRCITIEFPDFPMEFIDIPQVNFNIDGVTNIDSIVFASRYGTLPASKTNPNKPTVVCGTNATFDATISYIAKGKWK